MTSPDAEISLPTADTAGSGKGRLLVLTSTWPRWQGDTTTSFVRDLTGRLSGLGWETEVLAPHAPGAARDEVDDGMVVHRFRYLWPESAETVCYGSGALVNLRERPLELAKVPMLVAAEQAATLRAVRTRRPDVIHAHWLIPQGLVAGLVPGTQVTVLRRAPLGDPLEIRLRGYSLALRPSEAASLKFEVLSE